MILTRGAPDIQSGRIIGPESRFLYHPVSGRIINIIRPDSRIVVQLAVTAKMFTDCCLTANIFNHQDKKFFIMKKDTLCLSLRPVY